MRTLTATCLLAMTTMLTGCWPLALSPLYEKDEGELLEGLAGVWRRDDGGEEVHEFVIDPERRGYDVKVIADNQIVKFKVRIVRLGDAMFLDMLPVWGQESVPPLYGMTSMPMHAIFRLELTPDGEMFLTALNGDELLKRLQTKPDLIAHRMVDMTDDDEKAVSRLLLLASTKELRGFFETNAKDAALFSDPIKYVQAADEPGR